MRIAVLNGPNLNLLGTREPAVYGSGSLADLERAVRGEAERLGVTLGWLQTNDEAAFLAAVHDLPRAADAAVINAGAWTHTSLALRDALLGVRMPFVEVHLSNIFARDEVRRRSLLSDLAVAVVAGLGVEGYLAAVRVLAGGSRGG